MQFSKYHALGNDYLVLASTNFDRRLGRDEIRRVCHRHTGVGSDGILWAEIHSEIRRYSLRIFNPDGSEAAISGNGVRIFARYLWDCGYINDEPVEIETAAGVRRAAVETRGAGVSLALGRPSFSSPEIPMAGPPREVIDEEIAAGGRTYRFTGVTVGNPHCVIVVPRADAEEARAAGPAIENDPRFPERTNVQFVEVVDREHIRMEIWERGAGYTLSSGTSSAAAAAAVHRRGLAGSLVDVEMPGGHLRAEIGADGGISISGPVVKICQGTLAAELLLQRD
jgi:diaminopimelate epimerase